MDSIRKQLYQNRYEAISSYDNSPLVTSARNVGFKPDQVWQEDRTGGYDAYLQGQTPMNLLKMQGVDSQFSAKQNPIQTSVELNANNDNYGRMNYSGKIERTGSLTKDKVTEDQYHLRNYNYSKAQEIEKGIGYNAGLYANKTEGIPVNYGVYGGIGNDTFNAGINANSQGGFGVSGQYIPLGLQAYYNYIKGQNPNYGISFGKQYNF